MLIELASSSPRRRELLTTAGFAVEVLPPPDVDESFAPDAPVDETARGLARRKLDASLERTPPDDPARVRLAADTIVVSPAGRLLGKPSSQDEARAMIEGLSGRTHQVLTAVAWSRAFHDPVVFSVSTRVRVRPLASADISAYLATPEPWDKAGGYGIQGLFLSAIEAIEGCWPNVVGLPVPALVDSLLTHGALRGMPWQPSSTASR